MNELTKGRIEDVDVTSKFTLNSRRYTKCHKKHNVFHISRKKARRLGKLQREARRVNYARS